MTAWLASPVGRAFLLLTSVALPGLIATSAIESVRRDIALGHATVGLSYAVYWGMAAAASIPAAQLVMRLGPTRSARLAGLVSAACCALIAAFADSPMGLIGLLALGGLAPALARPGTNAMFTRGLAGRHPGAAFGVAQASVPCALLLAGAGAATVAGPLGWRALFVGAAALALLAALATPRLALTERSAGRAPAGSAARGPLIALALSACVGAAAVSGINAFMVASAPESGVSERAAALGLAIGGALSIAVRILAGVWADRTGLRTLTPVAWMIAAGALGLVCLAGDWPAVFLAGGLLMLTIGCGWTGLFNFLVLRRYPGDEERTTGVLQAGLFGGATAGPIGFGLLAEWSSYSTAWLALAGSTLVAAFIVLRAEGDCL